MVDYVKPYTESGDKWEELCNRCYRMRYQNYGYQEIPAVYKGDGGIEGFTDNGIAYQCYCPEKDYSDDDLYNHYRDKMHTDIGKFIDPKYEKTLKKLGLHDISEWHFVIPENRDKRLLEYRTQQVKRVLEYKSKYPEQCSYISDDFKIIIKIAEDFTPEIARMTRMQLGYELDLRLRDGESKIDWSVCPSEKVNNIKRKIKAVMGNVPDDDEDYKQVVTTFIEAYIEGLNMMEKLRKEEVDIYEEIMSLKSSYKRKVITRTRINSDHSLNQNIFYELMDDFQNRLKEKFVFLNQETRDELLYDIIGEWLADCPMQFKL